MLKAFEAATLMVALPPICSAAIITDESVKITGTGRNIVRTHIDDGLGLNDSAGQEYTADVEACILNLNIHPAL